MAQIDLRNALVEIIDGSATVGQVGAVADSSGVAAGATQVPIRGLSQLVGSGLNGLTFTIAGESGTPTHTITTTVGTPIRAINFTGAIASGGVANNAAITILNSGHATLSAAASAAATTVLVTGFTHAIPAGSTFTIGSESGSPVHTVVSTGGPTNAPTSITFTTAIASGGVLINATVTLTMTGMQINAPGAPVVGDTTIGVSGFTASIAVNSTFTLEGVNQTFTVLSTVGGSTPTSITFTPALTQSAGIPAQGAVIEVSSNALEVKIGEGTLTYNEKRNMEYVHNRRRVEFVRTGDDEPMDISFDFIWEFLSSLGGSDPITIEEAIKGSANAVTAGWVTSGADPCEPYCVDIRITYTPPCPGVEKEIITLKEYRWEGLNHDLKAGTVASTGKCKISTADLERAA